MASNTLEEMSGSDVRGTSSDLGDMQTTKAPEEEGPASRAHSSSLCPKGVAYASGA